MYIANGLTTEDKINVLLEEDTNESLTKLEVLLVRSHKCQSQNLISV